MDKFGVLRLGTNFLAMKPKTRLIKEKKIGYRYLLLSKSGVMPISRKPFWFMTSFMGTPYVQIMAENCDWILSKSRTLPL